MAEQHRCAALQTALRIGAGAVAVSLALAACGGGGAKTGAAAPGTQAGVPQTRLVSLIEAAPANTLAEETASVSGTVSSEGGDTPIAVHLSGAINFVAHQSQFTIKMADSGSFTTVFDEGVIYDEIPGFADMADGKSWMKIDLTSLSQSSSPLAGLGQTLQQALNYKQADPSSALDFLNGVSGTVTTVGTESVGGVETTHYRFPVDVQEELQRLSGGALSNFQQFIQALGITNPTVDVWLDAQGLVRQIRMQEALSSSSSGDLPDAIDTTFAFSDFGAPVTITVPPASQVTDLSQMLNGLGALGNLFGGNGSSGDSSTR